MKSNRIRNRKRSCAAALLGIIMMLLCAGRISAFPTKGVDESKELTLTVTAQNPSDKKGISGLKVTVYKAADMGVETNGHITFTLTSEFQPYDDDGPKKVDGGLDPNDFDSSNWASAAVTLAPHVISDAANGEKFQSATQTTGADGKANFTGLSQGLYLMTGVYTGTEYQSVEIPPVFLTLPQWSEDTAEWIYDAEAKVKPVVTAKPETPTSVTVEKIWAGDETATSDRPVSIVVELLDGSGATVDRQTLSASTAWKFTWTGLKAGNYSVKESVVPTGYAVSYEQKTTADGKTITVRNTRSGGGVLGASREKTDTSVKGSSRQADTGKVAGTDRLPQTGQLWWPVWLLAGLAAVLVILGLILRISGKRDLKDR